MKLPYNWAPRGYQQEAWDAFQTYRRLALCWHRRCLAPDTQITMADGSWRRIDELCVGDEILSWDGGVKIDRVKAVWPAGIKPVVKVSCSGFLPVTATPDHKFWIHQDGRKGRWQEIGTIQEKGAFGSRDNLAILAKSPSGGEAVPLAEFYGHMITDGSVHADQSPKYTNTRPELIDRVELLCSEISGVYPKKREKGNGWDLHLSNGTRGGGEIKNPVKELFRSENALTKHKFRCVPDSLWKADDKSLYDFFGGVIDGDGSLWFFKEKEAFGGKTVAAAAEIKIHAGESHHLAMDYYWLLRKLGILASSVSYERDSCWTVRIWSRNEVIKLLKNIVLHHHEKRKKQQQIINDIRSVRVRKEFNGLYQASAKIEDAGLSMTWDIETESTGCFFANGYLVHNSGKDEIMLHHNMCAAYERKGNYWYMLPEYAQCRKAIWEAVNPHTGKKRIDEAFPEVTRSNTLQQEMKIVFKNGSTWQLMGSDNYDSLVGSSPVGLTFSEYALANPSSWGYLSPIVLENNGWAIFNSTPRGKNHFYKMINRAVKDPEWFSQTLTVDDTKIFTEKEMFSELLRLQDEYDPTYGKALWLQEYYCSFDAARPGSIWGESLVKLKVEGRFTSVPYQEGYPVHSAWDLGWDDDTAIWFFQVIGNDIRVIDYYATNFKDPEFYAEELKKRAKNWVLGTHYLPHDAKPKTFASGGKSVLQQFFALRDKFKREDIDIGNFSLTPNLSVEDGIQAARATLKLTYFDASNCAEGFEHLMNYHRKYDEQTKTYSQTPKHDDSSHAADGFRYLSLVWKTAKAEQKVQSLESQLLTNTITQTTFGQLREEHFKKMRAQRAG